MFTRREYLLNSIEMVKDIPMLRMDDVRRARALALLARADQSDPLVPHVNEMLADPRGSGPEKVGPFGRLERGVRARLLRAADRPAFKRVVISLVVVWVSLLLVQLVGLTVFTDLYSPNQEVFRLGGRITNVPFDPGEKRFVLWAIGISTGVALAFALTGLYRLVRGNTLGALILFERALLIAIFFLQVFAFVHSQFSAVFGLLVDLGLFVAVRALLVQEYERRSGTKPPDGDFIADR
jgi:hypothetical protein